MVEKNQAGGGQIGRGSVVAGIDVGGTFTDLILIDARGGGSVSIAKVPTTPDNQAFGVVAALGETGFGVGESTSSSTAPRPPPTPCWSAGWPAPA